MQILIGVIFVLALAFALPWLAELLAPFNP